MNIKHILFPIDFSESSRALTPEVEAMANRFDAKVTLLHVFEIPVSWYGTGEAPLLNAECFEQFANDAKQRLLEYPIQLPADRVERSIAEGDPAWNIRKWAEEHDVDLIMMGTHGYGSMRLLFLGSVAMKVLHYVDCPVWTQRPREQDDMPFHVPPSKIICALELDEEAVPLLRFTKDLANAFGASVHISHSVPETTSRPYRYFDTGLHKYLLDGAAVEIGRYQKEAETDFPVSVSDGFVGADTAKLASEHKADLVVVGRGTIQRFFGTLRTHTYDIIRQVACPVVSYCGTRAASQGSAEKATQREPVLTTN
ncbi:MAG: universal stress protein [Bryobacteraceae bacterium]